MAFCAITESQLEKITLYVFSKMRENPNLLLDLKSLSKELFSDFIQMKASNEKAISFVAYLPQMIYDFNTDKENRSLLKKAGFSLDSVSQIEDTFDNFEELSKYLGLGEESNPVQIVTNSQIQSFEKVETFVKSTSISFDSNKRIINDKKYDTRVTDIASVGFKYDDDKSDESTSYALRHGNTIDAIAKQIFLNKQPVLSDFSDRITPEAFDKVISYLNKLKKDLEKKYVFVPGVTVYDSKTSISGEIDLLGIDKDGNYLVIDFKTANSRFNEIYLKKEYLTLSTVGNTVNIPNISKWQQYATQGYIYSKLLEKNLEGKALQKIVILGMNLVYDTTTDVPFSRINNVSNIEIHNIPFSDVRSEFKGKELSDIKQNYTEIKEKEKEPSTELKPVKKKRDRKNFDNLGEREKLDRLKKVDDMAATSYELEQELNFWKNHPLGKDIIINVDNVFNSRLAGQFKLDVIDIFKNAPKGTISHEAWHRFTQVFLTKEQKLSLYNDLKSKAISFTSRDGRKLNTKTASYIDIEEFLADEFSKYYLSPETYKFPKNESILSKIKEIFQAIVDFITRYNRESALDLFDKLYRGELYEYKPSVNNAFWGKLNSISTNGNQEEIISNERLPLYSQYFDWRIYKELLSAKKSFTSFRQSKALQNKVLNNVIITLRDKYNTDDNLTDQQFEEIERILQDPISFLRTYFDYSSYDSLKYNDLDDLVLDDNIQEYDDTEIGSYNSDELSDQESEDTDSKPERFDRSGNEDSPFTLAQGEIADFFRSIPKIKRIDEEGNLVYDINELGAPVNNDFYTVFYRIKKLLSGAFDMDDFLKRLSDPENIKLRPELTLINEYVTSIVNNNDEKNQERKIENALFLQTLYHIMSMPEVPNMQLFVNFSAIGKYNTFNKTIVSFDRATRNLASKIIQNWKKNFYDIKGKDVFDVNTLNFDNLDKTPLVVNSTNKVFLNPFFDYDKAFPNTSFKNILDFYETIGIELNRKALTDPNVTRKLSELKSVIISNIKLYADTKELDAIGLLESYADALGKDSSKAAYVSDFIKLIDDAEALDSAIGQFFIQDPITFFNEKREFSKIVGKDNIKKQTKSLKKDIEKLAEIEELYGDKVSSGAFRIEDKTKYPYYIPNSLLLTSEMLNKLKNISDFNNNYYLTHLNPQINPWMKYSYFIDSMFSYDGSKTNSSIIVEDIASYKYKDTNGKIVERHPKSLNETEKFFFDVLTFFSNGAIEIPRAETSSSIFSIRLSSNELGSLPIAFSDILGKGFSEKFHDLIKNSFLSELEKRKWYMKNEPSNALSKKFNIFQGILSPETLNKINNRINEDVVLDDETLSLFRADVENYFDEQSKVIEEKLNKLPDNYKTAIKDTIQSKNVKGFRSISRYFAFNYFIINNEFYNIFFGDLYFYKNPFKRGKYATNTGTPFYIDNFRNGMLNDLTTSTLSSIYNGVTSQAKDYRKVKTGVMNDIIVKSAYTQSFVDNVLKIREQLGVPLTQQDKEKLQNRYEVFNKMNIVDGQGVISLDFYRAFSIITKIWSPSKEQEYKRQLAFFRYNNNLYFKTDEDGNKVRLEEDEEEQLRSEDLQLIKSKPFDHFNPLKISYTGPQNKPGPYRPVFDKFSVRPALPEAAFGRRDNDLILKMAEGDIDYMKFESGSKVYKDNSFELLKKLSEGEYDFDDFNIAEEVKTNDLYSAYLKHQLDTDKIKNESILGSQFRKILFGMKYLPHVRENASLYKYFDDLENKAISLIHDLIETEEQDLFNTLGIVREGDVYRTSDLKRFVKLLTDQAIANKMTINSIEYISYNEATKDFSHPISYAFNRQEIQNLISGLIDRKLRRLKVNGTSMIQVSSVGYESRKFTKPTDNQLSTYGTNGLYFYPPVKDADGNITKIQGMGIKIALNGEFENLLELNGSDFVGGDKIRVDSYDESLKRLNASLKDPVWREKHIDKLRILGYRIPTQKLSFIANMEVVEFLPKSAGSIIILPPEFLIASGSDFDIDKMNTILPSIKSTGELAARPKETIKEINDAIKNLTYEEQDRIALSKEYSNVLNSSSDKIKDLISNQKKIRLTIIDLFDKIDSSNAIDDIVKSFDQEDYRKKVMSSLSLSDEDWKKSPNMDEVDLEQRLLNKAIYDFYAIDAKIEQLIKKYDETSKLKAKIDQSDLVPFRKRKTYKKAINNELLGVFSEALSHPAVFELLIDPSDSNIVNDSVNNLISLQSKFTNEQKEEELRKSENKLFDRSFTPTENSTYTKNLSTYSDLMSKRLHLGSYAIQRTFADIFSKVKFSIAQEYVNKDDTKELYFPLISPENRGKLVKNGRVQMFGESETGIPISDQFNQLITATVDIGNSPAYAKMGINDINKSQFIYLIHQKVDIEPLTLFFNQPILRELYDLYEKNKLKVLNYTVKHALVELAIKKKALSNPLMDINKPNSFKYIVYDRTWIPAEYDEYDELKEGTGEMRYDYSKANAFLRRPYSDLHNNLSKSDFFSKKELEEAILNDDKDSALQKKVLSYFASITEEASYLRLLEFSNNVDTNKYSTLTSLIRNFSNKLELSRNPLFDKNQLKEIENNTMISPFDYTKKAFGMMKSLFPELYSDSNVSTFANLALDVFGLKNVQIERISKIIENDFIEFIYKNYYTYKGNNFSDYFEPYLINKSDQASHFYMSDKLMMMLGKYPELRDIEFVDNLVEDTYTIPYERIENSYLDLDNKEIKNIFFNRNPDNPINERNIFTNQWKNLIYSPSKLGLDKIYTEEDLSEISEFFRELAYFSLYQGGATNTGNGFSDLIPWEIWANVVESSFRAYEEDKKKNPYLETEALRIFEIRFKQMNPRIPWKTKYIELNEKDSEGNNKKAEIEFYKNYYRGKHYKFDEFDVQFMRENALYNEDNIIEENNKRVLAKLPDLDEPPVEVGRYVKYADEVYIIVKPLKRNRMWQIYNPLKEGYSAKLSVHERNLIPLKKMGVVVVAPPNEYIVTEKDEIISLKDHKKVKWDKNSIMRKNILDKANQKRIKKEGGFDIEDTECKQL